jgi:hypothetical protein
LLKLGISIIIVTTLVFVNPMYVFAKMRQISILNQTIDTQKPLVQQYEQAFERTKTAVTPSQYDRVLQKLQFKWKNATSSCASMSVIFKGAQFQCDQIYSLVSIICNTPTAKSQMVLCIDPFVNEYLKSRNITGTNIERFARY